MKEGVDMTKRLEKKETLLGNLLRQLYIRACLDAISPKNKGKGQSLCEDRIKVIRQQIIEEILKEIPKRFDGEYDPKKLNDYYDGVNEGLRMAKERIWKI